MSFGNRDGNSTSFSNTGNGISGSDSFGTSDDSESDGYDDGNGSWNDSLGCGRGWVGATVHGMARGAIKTPVWAHATTANPTPPGPWEGAKPKGGGGSLDSEQRHTPRAAHVPLVMCGGLLVGTEVQGADSALATRTCPGRRSEPWWEGDKASGMLRCLITGASAGSRA